MKRAALRVCWRCGSHRVTFNRKGMASGAVVYRIMAGAFIAVRRFVLMR